MLFNLIVKLNLMDYMVNLEHLFKNNLQKLLKIKSLLLKCYKIEKLHPLNKYKMISISLYIE